MAKEHIPAKLKVGIDARKRFHLSHAQVQMARELGHILVQQGRIDEAEAPDQDLEGAEVALVGELAFEHVEPHLSGSGDVVFASDETEGRGRVDEAAIRSRRSHAVSEWPH